MTEKQGSIERIRKCFDEDRSRRYRLGDEQVVATSDSYIHYGSVLRDLSASFLRPIDILDAGCGSGRYFHCLRNVRRLVGVDVSPHMIEQARNPVKVADIEAATIELICGDVFNQQLQLASFDCIYSIGVYGEYSPIDDALLARFASLLSPGGVLFITAVDIQSRVSAPATGRPSVYRRFVRKVFPLLPCRVRERANRLLSPDYVSRSELEALFARSEFKEFSVTAYCHVSGWMGTHWDCRAMIKRLDPNAS